MSNPTSTSERSSTDLHTLSSIFPARSRSDLLRFYSAASQNVERATMALLGGDETIVGNQARKRRKVDSGGLEGWLGIKKEEGKGKGVVPSSSASASASITAGMTAVGPTSLSHAIADDKPSAFSRLLTSASSATTLTTNIPPRPKFPPLILNTAEQIKEHTGGLCTLVENVLPKELAARLFLRMVDESLGNTTSDPNASGAEGKPKGWEKNRWYLFEREVESPHTTAFYVQAPAGSGASGSAYDQKAFEEAAQYWYNGEKRSASTFNAEMDEAREVIGPLVRKLLAQRDRNPLEWNGSWEPNVAAANCYRGSKESVGWHSDVLSYLGPYPTIASLSLGVSRPFRLRAAVPVEQNASSIPPRTLQIQLPHNTLLVMHAGCQEKFKHTVPEVRVVDTFRIPRSLVEVDQGSKIREKWGSDVVDRRWTERINMTFRFYRPDFAPLPTTPVNHNSISPTQVVYLPPKNYIGTPLCRCSLPTQLRADAKGKVASNRSKQSTSDMSGSTNVGLVEKKSLLEGEEDLLFFWTCNGGAQNKGKGCGFFELMDMEKEGRGKWWMGARVRDV